MEEERPVQLRPWDPGDVGALVGGPGGLAVETNADTSGGWRGFPSTTVLF